MFNILIHLLGDSISSLFWGILAGGGLTALLFILARGWRRDASFTPLSYAVGAVTGILLIIQCTLVSGSLALMTQVDTVHDRSPSSGRQRHEAIPHHRLFRG